MLEKLNHLIPVLLLKPECRFYRHLLLQVIVVLITISNLWDDPGTIRYDRLWIWLFAYIMLSAIIYLNIYLLVPRMLLARKTKRYIFSLVAIMLFMISCNIFFYFYLSTIISFIEDVTFVSIYFISNISNTSLLLAGITAIFLFKNDLKSKGRIEELQAATMEVELANLKNQINPHFLFNMLNNATILAAEDTQKSSQMLTKLNSLLKYQMEGSSLKSVSLSQDIDFLSDYLELEKTRRGRFSYTLIKEGNCDIRIPPLLFIPFVENAVKHNPESDSNVSLTFRIEGGWLHFECTNPKPRLFHTKRIGGIGLVNVRRRLDLLFGANYSLALNDEEENYTVIMEFKI